MGISKIIKTQKRSKFYNHESIFSIYRPIQLKNMTQKEIIERIISKRGKKDYYYKLNSLTIYFFFEGLI
jgi:hypothetical protein